MSVLVSVGQFREWSGANVPSSVPDSLIDTVLDEATAQIAQESGQLIATIMATASTHAIAFSDCLRRASRLLARRNSPESIAGSGSEGLVTIPARDPDSAGAIRQIRSILLTPEAVA